MFNSLFKKLTLVYLIVILITLGILGVSLAKMFENYYFDKKGEALIEGGKKLNSIVIRHLNNEVGYERLVSELEALERYLNTKIWIIDKYGFIYGVSNQSESNWIGKQLSKEEIINVLKGNTIVKVGEYDEIFGGPVMTAGIPIVINGRVENGVFMHSPILEIQETLKEVYKIILISMTLSFIIAVILIYFTSQRISKPILEISNITKVIASGDFHKRLDIDSQDEIGQLSKSFNYMAQELEKIEDMRRTFIADVSHELRSPLTLIRGYVDGIMEVNLSEDKKHQYLKIIKDETNRLTELINNMLDLSKMESGGYVLNLEEFDINELIRRNILKYSTKLEEKNVNVEVEFEEDPIHVRADRDNIAQVLSNLIDNSIKFMDCNGTLNIRTTIAQHKCYVSIRDTGIGIPHEELDNIWKRFYKGDKSRSKQVRGTGLGLSIVKEIIRKHGENIEVNSSLGEGTTFTFTLALN